MHPSREVERVEYAVRVRSVDESKLRDLGRGVQLEDGPAAFKTTPAAAKALTSGTT